MMRQHPWDELLGLDKALRSIWGLLEVERVKKVQLEECIERGKRKLTEIVNNKEYDNGIRNRIERLNDDLKVMQESINLLKGRLTSQIKGIKVTMAKVLDKAISKLAKKIGMLFSEQGIMITSILTAIGMTTGVLVDMLLPDGGTTTQDGAAYKGGKSGNVTEWLRNKLKVLASLIGIKAVTSCSTQKIDQQETDG